LARVLAWRTFFSRIPSTAISLRLTALRCRCWPEIPLHTNGSERDIRCYVIKRKISGGTHSETGRDCRDAFLGLMHTCRKLGIAFWDYLGDRLNIQPQSVAPYLPELIRCRGQPA
jgi:hypothetical protein